MFGLVGENGAGKSTLIKHLLGLWRAETARVRVFGIDPVVDPPSVLGRIGYRSEQPDLPGWMRVGELLRYTQAFYPRWDGQYAGALLARFGLEEDARVRTLLLFSVFSYTDSGGSRGFATFPQRLFILPVSSLRLVSTPVLAGIVATELLYLLWLEPL
jgi:ABC-type glutathione transport system ATPase component